MATGWQCTWLYRSRPRLHHRHRQLPSHSRPDMEDFEHDRSADILDVIYEPDRTMFHRAITNRLREKFRALA